MSSNKLNVQILAGAFKDKRKYYAVLKFPTTLVARGHVKTNSLESDSPEWNHNGSVDVTGRVMSDSAGTVEVVEDKLFPGDKGCGKGVVNIGALQSQASIESVEVKITDKAEEIGTVTLRFDWEDASKVAGGGGGGQAPAAAAVAAGGNGGSVPAVSGAPLAAGPVVPLPPCEDQDFTIRLHIHKARNLQNTHADKIFDALVVAEVDKQSQATEFVPNTNDPTFEEDLVFQLTKVPSTFWSQGMQLTVMDHYKGIPNKRIGSVQFDMATVYRANPQHFLRGKWLAIHRSEGTVMGFLKISVAVLNSRTDAFPDELAEQPDELEDEDAIVQNLMVTPGTAFEEISLICRCVKAEGLPAMDPNGKADPYMKIRFGTKKAKTAEIKETLTPEWNAMVALPMQLPSLTSMLTIELWDYDFTSADDLIGTHRMDLSALLATDAMPVMPPRWINVYGHPRNADADFSKFYMRMAKGEMPGCEFRGRFLFGMMGEKKGFQPFDAPQEPINEVTVEVTAVVQLLEFSLLSKGDYVIDVSVGNNHEKSKKEDTHHMVGSETKLTAVFFGEELRVKGRFSVVLPTANAKCCASLADQIPDLIVQLRREGIFEKDTPYATIRFPAKRLLARSDAEYYCDILTRDTDPKKVPEGENLVQPIGQMYCGMFLSDATDKSVAVEPSVKMPAMAGGALSKFVLECHVYQARAVPAGDSNGLSDPFIRVSFGNAVMKTGRKLETLNPIYNETMRLIADVKQPFPAILVEVMDWDRFGSDTFLCKRIIPIDDAIQEDSAGKLRWYGKMTDTRGREVETELLLAFEMKKGVKNVLEKVYPTVKMPRKLGCPETYDGIPIPADKALPLSTYRISMNIFGLRHMKKFHLRGIKSPSLDVEIAGRSEALPKLRGSMDFNKGVDMVMELPSDPKYLPQLNIRVYDHRAIGPKALIGACVVDIGSPKWNPQAKRNAVEAGEKRHKDLFQAIRDEKTASHVPASGQTSPSPEGHGVAGATAKLLSATKVIGGAARHAKKTPSDDSQRGMHEPLLPVAGDTEESPLLRGQPVPPPGHGSPGDAMVTVDFTMAEARNEVSKLVKADDSSMGARVPSGPIIERPQKEDDVEWFDRFEPIDDDLSPDLKVSRFGKLHCLHGHQRTVEDVFGPFDDFATIELNRGWGSDRVLAGHLGFDMTVVKEQPEMLTSTNTVSNLSSRQPIDYILRCYVLKCTNLAAMDTGVLGKTSDPYLIISLGGGKGAKNKKFALKESTRFQTLNPDFFIMQEMEGSLPADNTLKITVMDYDKIGFDEEIGSTDMELENRWYSPHGYATYRKTMMRPGCYTETRELRNSLGQITGQIEMWVDMFPATEDIPRPISIEPPPPEQLELRCIVWNTRDVILQESNVYGEEMTDIYVRCWIDGMPDDVQSTDVHYRSLDGAGNFNWRMSWPVVFHPREKRLSAHHSADPSLKERLSSFFSIRKEDKLFEPVLHMQIWDNDLLPGTDDFIGESVLPLTHLKPVLTHRNMTTFLQEVAGCCNDCWPLKICCGKKVTHKEMSLAEKQELAHQEAREEYNERQRTINEQVDTKLALLKASGKYTPAQLDRMRVSLFAEAVRKTTINIFDTFTPKPKSADVPEDKSATKVIETPKFWFACRGPDGGGRVGDVQISFQLVRLKDIEEDANLGAGKGRADPNKLPEPKRPDSSFFWLSSPWKSAVHILWKNYKWYIITVICLVLSAIFLYLFFAGFIDAKTHAWVDGGDKR